MLRPSARSSLRGTSTASGASRQITGSNSERGARSARSSIMDAVAPGSMPVLGSTRPRYLIRSARVQVLLSCWASATAFCAAGASSSEPGGSGLRVPAPACPAPSCQTNGATDASGTPSVRASLSAQPLCSSSKSSTPSLATRVLKFDACASCASSRCDPARASTVRQWTRSSAPHPSPTRESSSSTPAHHAAGLRPDLRGPLPAGGDDR